LHLRYCIFDWDDNVMHMPTKIWMEDANDGTPVGLGTAEYATRRHDKALKHTKTSFREFQDGTGDFEGDLRRTMEGVAWKGPAFGAFIEAVKGGRLFAIVTARGHNEESIRRAVSGFIETVLSANERDKMLENLRLFNVKALHEASDTDLVSDYLKLCRFIGVTNPAFVESKGIAPNAVEEGKKIAIREFVKCTVDMAEEVFVKRGQAVSSISFGMSDDDRKNVEAADKLFVDELSPVYSNVKFVVFDTGGRSVRRLKYHLSDPDKYKVPESSSKVADSLPAPTPVSPSAPLDTVQGSDAAKSGYFM